MSKVPGIRVERDSAIKLAAQFKEKRVLVLPTGEHTIRAVASLAFEADDIAKAIDAIGEVMSAPPK